MRVVFVAVFAGGILASAPAGAQPPSQDSQGCPPVEELVADASAVLVGEVIEVRSEQGSDPDGEAGDAIVLRVTEIGKGGAQNPLIVYYPESEVVPELEAGTELNVIVNYDTDGTAQSTLSCRRTTDSENRLLIAGDTDEFGALGETAGETAQEALRAAALLGGAVIAATILWRVFREFWPSIG